ncbi:hypothetical protein GW17_00054559 [Ensete ventricosum]|nr:hypothetical protein GW17_00054559 [Ensete ventricosum]
MALAWRADDSNRGCDSGGQGRRDEVEGSGYCCCVHSWEERPIASALAEVGLGGRWYCDRGRREVGVGDGSGAATGSAWLGVTC